MAVLLAMRRAMLAPASVARPFARLASSTRYTKEHEWATLDSATGVATCGVTDFAQSALGDVVFVSLPDAGRAVKKGEAVAGVESVKAASDVYAPLSGKVVESNKATADDPSTVNKSAESSAWFFKIAASDAGKKEFAAMLDRAAYDAHVKASKH